MAKKAIPQASGSMSKGGKGAPPPVMKGKKEGFPPGSNMKTEKKEERQGKDLDHDGEKGEPAAHKARVLGSGGSGGSKKNGPAKKK